MTYVVSGVSGNTGSVVANCLLERKQQIRVLVRDQAKAQPFAARGAEIAIADVTDAAALARELTGAKGAYLLIPPNLAAPDYPTFQREVIESYAKALEASKVPHVVFLSSVGAQHESGTGPIVALHDAEQRLSKLANTRVTFVRAGYFMENLGQSLGTLPQGFIGSFTKGELPYPMVAVADIGRTVAEALLAGPSSDPIIELSAATPLTMNDVAATLSKLLGKSISVAEAPLDSLVPTLTGLGLPRQFAELYHEMTAAMISGHLAFEGGHRRIYGTTGLEAVLKKLLSNT